MKNEYLNEERYQSSNQKVKKIGNILIIIGLILLGIGFILIVAGFLGFGSQFSQDVNASKAFSGIGIMTLGSLMAGPGFLITIVGLIIRFLIGNRREITAYTTQQVMPIAQEGIEKMAPTIGKAGEEIAKGISKGIKEGMKDK